MIRLVRRNSEQADDVLTIPVPEESFAGFYAENGKNKGIYTPTGDLKAWLRRELWARNRRQTPFQDLTRVLPSVYTKSHGVSRVENTGTMMSQHLAATLVQPDSFYYGFYFYGFTKSCGRGVV